MNGAFITTNHVQRWAEQRRKGNATESLNERGNSYTF